jgi:hypothetical protein
MRFSLMTPSNPLAAINVNGDSTRRGVTLQVPKDQVRACLPPGLELGPQNLTVIPGTHPVLLFFNDMFRLHWSMPTLVPSVTYHELHIGIPYTYLSTGPVTPGAPGPYYFMPRLHLDNWSAIFGGLVFWGFAKRRARFCVTVDSYTVTTPTGEPVASLKWEMPRLSLFQAVSTFEHFKPVQQAMSQTIISMAPASLGPYFTLTDFSMAWDSAELQPLHTAVEADGNYLPGYPGGRIPLSGWSVEDIRYSPLGSYELRASWQVSLPYPPPHSFRR